jgi:hypothetical protein
METSSRCGYGSGGRRKDSLVSFGIRSVWFTLNVGRQRHFTGPFQIQGFAKLNFAIAIFKNSNDLTTESRFDELAANREPRSWPDQAPPGAIVDLPEEKDFCIPGLEPDASRDHSSVIQNQQLLRRNEIDEIAKPMMRDVSMLPINQHQSGIAAGCRRPECD